MDDGKTIEVLEEQPEAEKTPAGSVTRAEAGEAVSPEEAGTGRVWRGGPRRMDLTGMRFGKLTVLGPAPDIGGCTAWRCRCDCGNEVVVLAGNLRSGRTKSCGCMGARKDLAGMKFGKLKAVKPAANIGQSTAWLCKCDCGNEVTVRTSSLTGGMTRSCGCLRDDGRLDLTGDRYGRLTVLGRAPDTGGQPAWRCRCDCGNETVVRMCDLRTGHTRSCGCLALGEDLTGRVFDRLTVLERAGSRGKNSTWRCRCECGNEVTVPRNNLVSGGTRSCGCLRKDAKRKENTGAEKRIAASAREAPGTGDRPQEPAGRRKLDLAGMRFGKLEVLGPAPDIGGKTAWRCRCDCGNEAVVKTCSLTGGKTKSCGCLRGARRQDLTGRVFGSLTALEPARDGAGCAAWLCKCDCGNEVVVRTDSLTSGGTRSCGCMKGAQRLDLSGQKFGHLTALEPAGDVNGQTTWLCRCDCGNEAVVRTSYLTGKTVTRCSDPACPFSRKNQRDLAGKTFGHLTVLGPDGGRDPKSRPLWRCRCECGRETAVTAGTLKSGRAVACGHPACPHSRNGKQRDLAGRTFGWLTALEQVEDVDGMPAWRCRCRCGNEITVQAARLRKGYARDCGCRKAAQGQAAAAVQAPARADGA